MNSQFRHLVNNGPLVKPELRLNTSRQWIQKHTIVTEVLNVGDAQMLIVGNFTPKKFTNGSE